MSDQILASLVVVVDPSLVDKADTMSTVIVASENHSTLKMIDRTEVDRAVHVVDFVELDHRLDKFESGDCFQYLMFLTVRSAFRKDFDPDKGRKNVFQSFAVSTSSKVESLFDDYFPIDDQRVQRNLENLRRVI